MHRDSRLYGVLQTYMWTEQSVRGVPGRGPEPSCQGPAATGRRRQVYNMILCRSPYNSQFQFSLFFLPSSLRHPSIISPCPVPDSAALVVKLSLCQPPTIPDQRQPSHHGPKIAQITTPTVCPKWPVDELPPVPLRSSASYDGRAPTNDSRRRPPRPCWADGARRNGGKRKKR